MGAERREPRTSKHEALCRELAEKLIPPLRAKAQELGYALGVHGSLAFDIDLIAAPWQSHAVSARELAEALQKVTLDIRGIAFQLPGKDTEWFLRGCPGGKPHGRLSWTYHLGGGPYLDISVMPRVDRHTGDADPACLLKNNILRSKDDG